MTLQRILQIALLAASLAVGVSSPVFNGQSLLALILAVAPLAIAYRWGRASANNQH